MKGVFSLKIFLVDNDIFSLALYEQYLRNMGCKDVTSFSNENACLLRISENPKIVLLDFRTNASNGLKLLIHLKTINPDIFVVFITGPSNIVIAAQSLDAGAFDFIIRDENYIEKLQKVLLTIHQVDKLVYESPSINPNIY